MVFDQPVRATTHPTVTVSHRDPVSRPGLDLWRLFGRQRQPLSIVLADNLHRAERLNFTFVLHTPTAQYGGAMRTSDSDSKYGFNVTVSDMGTFVLEIFLGGVQVAA